MNVHPNNDNAIYYLLMFPKITIITVVHLGIYKSVKLPNAKVETNAQN